jgi:hypothetical protein
MGIGTAIAMVLAALVVGLLVGGGLIAWLLVSPAESAPRPPAVSVPPYNPDI